MKTPKNYFTDSVWLIQIITGILSVVIGLSVMIGWHTGKTSIITMFTAFVPMMYNTALCFVLCGITILLGAKGFHRPALATGIVVLIIGALTVIEYSFGINLGIDQLLMNYYVDFQVPNPGRMALITAIGFFLAGLAFVVNLTKIIERFSVGGILGSIILIMGITGAIIPVLAKTAVTGYLMNIPIAYRWGIFSVMAVHTSFGFWFVGGGIVAQSWVNKKSKSGNIAKWIPVFVTLGMIAITLNFYFALRTQQQISIQQSVNEDSEKLKYAIENAVNERILALERMAERWTQRGGTNLEEWTSDAKNYNRDFKTFQALEWVDSKLYIRWIEPVDGNQSAINTSIANKENQLIAEESAITPRRIFVSKAVDLLQGGLGIYFYAPVYKKNEFDGFIIGISKTDQLFQTILPTDLKNDYEIKIVENEKDIYLNDLVENSTREWSNPQTINLPDVSWTAAIRPRPATLEKFDSIIPESVLIIGFFISFLIGGTIYLLQRSQREIAERIRVEKELNQSEEYLRQTSILQELILNSANYSIIACDTNGFIKTFNKTAEKWLGYKSEEVINKLTPEIIHDFSEIEEQAQKLTEKLGKKIEPNFETFATLTEINSVDEREWTYIRKDGSRFPVLLSISPMYNKMGEKTGFLGIGYDITFQKQSEKALRESEHRYRELTEKSLGLICTHDLEGKFLSVNPAAAKAIGYSSEEVIGKSIKDFLQTENKSLLQNYLDKIKETGEFSGQMKLLTKSGEKRVWQFRNTLYQEGDGEIYVLGHAQDITENMQIADELRESQALFERFMNNSPAVIYMKDEDGKFEFINHPLESVFKVNFEELRGKDDYYFLSPEVADSVRKNDKLVLESNKTIEATEIVPTPDGVLRYWQSFKFPIITKNGKRFVGGVSFDVTETKKLTSELEKAYQAALESARIKTEFLANTSHEIRTPMNGVIGMTELLMNTNLTSEQREYAETIRKSGELLLNIISDILDFSKIEAGKLNIEVIDFNLRETVDSVTEIFAKQASEKNIEIISTIQNQVTNNLRGDPNRLRQILNNLVGNAVKFTESGQVILNIKVEKETETSVDLRFEITDTGIGIKSEIQSQLFQSFTQADGSTTRKYGGTGLGLAISKQLVELMNGEIGLESTIGKGSTFWFTVTFEKQSINHLQVNVTELNPQSESPKKNKKSSSLILVVEDSIINQKVILGYLKHLGFSADVASDGKQALDILENSNYKLVLMDCQMPVMDGYSATIEFRKREAEGKHLPIVALTANAMDGVREKCLSVGMDDYLTKPIDRVQFTETIMRWLKQYVDENVIDLTTPKHKVNPQSADNTISKRLKVLFEVCDAELIVEIIELFLEKSLERLNLMSDAIENKDIEKLKSESHALKGSCSNVGAESMAAICQRIESTESIEITPHLAELINNLYSEYYNLKPQFEFEKELYEKKI